MADGPPERPHKCLPAAPPPPPPPRRWRFLCCWLTEAPHQAPPNWWEVGQLLNRGREAAGKGGATGGEDEGTPWRARHVWRVRDTTLPPSEAIMQYLRSAGFSFRRFRMVAEGHGVGAARVTFADGTCCCYYALKTDLRDSNRAAAERLLRSDMDNNENEGQPA